MCFANGTKASTSDCWALLRHELQAADAVVVGAGAGLSTSAGFVYSGERFQRYFADFEAEYGFHDMYTGGFYPFPSREAFWAYWSRYVLINRYMDAPKPFYQTLLKLLADKDYFVLTTNVDHCFQKAGFDKKRLFQCSQPCCQQTWDNEASIREMAAGQKNLRVPTRLLPVCPRCGKPMSMNLRSDDTFVQDEGWYQAAERYQAFLRRLEGRRVLFWELGVGYNTPGIIKYPFWRMTLQNPSAFYACLNLDQAFCPKEIADRSVCIGGDIGDLLDKLGSFSLAQGKGV